MGAVQDEWLEAHDPKGALSKSGNQKLRGNVDRQISLRKVNLNRCFLRANRRICKEVRFVLRRFRDPGRI